MPAPSKPPRTRTTGTSPVVLVKWYDVAKWLLERVDSFPKNQRFIFGQRIAADILEIKTQAGQLETREPWARAIANG